MRAKKWLEEEKKRKKLRCKKEQIVWDCSTIDNPFVMPRHRQSLCYAPFMDKSVWRAASRTVPNSNQHQFFSWKVILDMVQLSNSLSAISSELLSSARRIEYF